GWRGTLRTRFFPAAGRIVAAWIPFGARAWANGLVLGATTIGVSAAPVLFGALSDRFGWRLACVVMGAVTALLTCLWVWYGRNRPAEHASADAAELALVGPATETAAA